ncbi:MAG: hypothetical protein KGO02_05635 [Alphaproteobacteria bacterium]|nr:hypothetical protein [Alphaproteobacteria bacterium]
MKKFAEGARYAPNWGRLRLKWAQALLWSGDKRAALRQAHMASHLVLTPSERGQLTLIIARS